MARILAVDDDALARAVLVDALRGMHHEVVSASGGREALDRLKLGDFALVITDVMMPEMDGIELARRVAGLEKAPPVLLASGVRDQNIAGEARARGVSIAGFVPKPLDSQALREAINSAMGTVVKRGREFTGADTLLEAQGGAIEEWPPHRLLFLAHRVSATGTLHVDLDDRHVAIALRGGRVVFVQGVNALLRSLGRDLAETPSLSAAIEGAIARGVGVEEALRAAAQGLGEFLASLVGRLGGLVRWEADADVPANSVPLDTPIPRILAMGFRGVREHARVLSFWSTADRLQVTVFPPDDAPESRWGLDMTTLRVLRVASRYSTVGEVIAAAVGSDPQRRTDVVRSLDFLHLMGIVELGSAVASAGNQEPALDVESAGMRGILEARLAEIGGLPPVDVLGLGARASLTLADVGAAWRERGGEVHPDRFDVPEVQRAAVALFDRLRGANEILVSPGGLDEANKLLAARRAGKQFVSDRDRTAARVALHRGELLFRSREWKTADVNFVEAYRLDPDSWPIPYFYAWGGWLSRRLSAVDAVRRLQALTPPRPKEIAEVHVVIGAILKLEGKPEDALAQFRIAAERDPDNRDAQRELRLQDRRSVPVAPRSTEGKR